MLPVLGLAAYAELAVEQELVSVEPDVVLTVWRRYQDVNVLLDVDKLAAHLGDDVVKDTPGVVCTFA